MQQATLGYNGGGAPHVLQVTIPPNATPGSVLRIMDPMTNQMVEFVVPQGAYPGSTINLSVGGTQPAPVVYQQAPQPAVMGAPTTVIVKERRNNDAAADSCLGTLAACCLVCACCELMSLAR
jgi:hypothetical protein